MEKERSIASMASSDDNPKPVVESIQGSDLSPIRSTEANILPQVQDTSTDVEKVASQTKAAPPNLMDPASFPDGGLRAWLTCLGGFFCLFCSFGWING
jgi:hypothetical protein